MPAVEENAYDGLKFSVGAESEHGFREVEALTVTAAEVIDDPDHPLYGMSALGFDMVEISGEIVHGDAQILATAQAPLRLPDRPFIRKDEGDATDEVVLELSAQSGGERIVDVVVASTSGTSSENNLREDRVTEEAWQWLEAVRDGIKAAVEARHVPAD